MDDTKLYLHCDNPDCKLDGVRIASYKRGFRGGRQATLDQMKKVIEGKVIHSVYADQQDTWDNTWNEAMKTVLKVLDTLSTQKPE